MGDERRRRLARSGTVALFAVAVVLAGLGARGVLAWIQLAWHTHLPASTWLVVESVRLVVPSAETDGRLAYRTRGLRHRPFEYRRTATLNCSPHEGMLAAVTPWPRVGPEQRTPRQAAAPAVIGYAADEPVPQSLIGAERLPGLEVWPGPLPQRPSDCVIAFRWIITTAAGAEHVVTTTSDVVRLGLPPALEPTPAPPPAPTAAELLDDVDESADAPPPATLEDTLAPRTAAPAASPLDDTPAALEPSAIE